MDNQEQLQRLSALITAIITRQDVDFTNLTKLIGELDNLLAEKEKELSYKLQVLKDRIEREKPRDFLTKNDVKDITQKVLSLVPPVDRESIIQDVLKSIPEKVVKPIQIFPRESVDKTKIIEEVLKQVPLPEPIPPEKSIEEITALLDARTDKWLDAKHLRNLEENIDPQKLKLPSPTIVNRYHATEFRRLQDTPDSFEGQAGKVVKVKSDETGLEFGTGGSGSTAEFLDIVSGDIDNTNKEFEFAEEPDLIVVNGVTLRKDTSTSTTRFTWSSPNATLHRPIGTGGDIWGIKF